MSFCLSCRNVTWLRRFGECLHSFTYLIYIICHLENNTIIEMFSKYLPMYISWFLLCEKNVAGKKG